ncbi:MAG: hypothetical protein AAGA99_00200 [Actinomycetota bacterium]
MSIRRPAVWLLRVVWFVTGPTVAGAVDGAFGAFSDPVRIVAVALVWAWWAVGLLAVLVPSPLGLTVIRVAAPGAAAVAALSAFGDRADPLAIGLATAAALLALTAQIGDDFVDASSYGPERRMPLRVPGPLLLGPIPFAAAVALVGTTVGPLLLAGGAWLVGVPATLLGLPAAWLALRALHQLSRRWLVFVPGGVVVHDQMVVLDALLCRRDVVRAITPALAGTEADDLTLGALGRALEIDLAGPVDYVPAAGRNGTVQLERTRAVLISPTRPGLALQLAADHRLPTTISSPSPG